MLAEGQRERETEGGRCGGTRVGTGVGGKVWKDSCGFRRWRGDGKCLR